MEIQLAELTLGSIDAADVEAVALFIVDEERPLRGLAGLCDWRMYGALSRALREGWFAGSLGETLLVPARLGQGQVRVFVFGLGAGAALRQAQALEKTLPRAFQTLRKAGVASCCLSLPWPGCELEDSLERWARWAPQGPERQLLLGEVRPMQRWIEAGQSRFPELRLLAEAAKPAPRRTEPVRP